MAGNSPQEQMGQSLYGEVSNFNPTVTNRFNNYSAPFNPGQMVDAINQFTNLGTSQLQKQIGSNVANAGSSTAARLRSAGYGGAVLSDAVSGARERAAANGNNALEKLQADRLSLMPGIMSEANREQFNVTNAATNVDFGNVNNQFKKYGTMQGLLGAFSPDSTLDDVLGVIQTIGNLGKGVTSGLADLGTAGLI